MILIEGKKYACDTCIKGHRSSACKHTDRPLFEIQKKGRPITQCSHCRELRKTKQVHVKCQCGDGKGKDEPGAAKTVKKALDAAYPTGVPTTLEASLVLVPDPSSDSDQPGSKPALCSCKSDGECHCAVPRKIKRTRQKDSTSAAALSRTPSCPKLIRPHTDLTRDYRPVLPKPTQPQHIYAQIHPGPLHVPSTQSNGHATRHHSHADMFYSPYGRAYESLHSYDRSYEMGGGFVDSTSIGDMNGMNNIVVTNPDGQSIPWNFFNTTGASAQSICGCGESCACPGCFEHRGPTAALQCLLNTPSGAECVDPNTCTSCFGGSVVAGPVSQASPADIPNVDEWIRHLAVPLPLSYGSQPLVYATQQQMQGVASTSSLPQYNMPTINPNSPDHWIRDQFDGPTECCGGTCKCPPGLCSCASDCCGCCQGCTCENHQHRARRQITFAVSGERAPCRSGGVENVAKMDVGDVLSGARPLLGSSSAPPSRRSRASSASLSDGGQEEWDRGPSFRSCCSKERTTSPQVSLYVSANDSNMI